MITIISGGRGTGKTTLLLEMIEKLKAGNQAFAGILTPAVFDADGNKAGFDALDAASGSRWELGKTGNILDGPYNGRFSFSNSGFIRANNILKKALTQKIPIVFLDEIGPLELQKKKGFYPVLSLIGHSIETQRLFLVIRPELINTFIREVIPEQAYKIIDITNETASLDALI